MAASIAILVGLVLVKFRERHLRILVSLFGVMILFFKLSPFLKFFEKIKEYKEKIKNYLFSGRTIPHLIKTFTIYALIALSIILTKVLIARLYGQEELGIFSYFFAFYFSQQQTPDRND